MKRRRLAKELRAIYQSVIRYIKNVNEFIDLEESKNNQIDILEQHESYEPSQYNKEFTKLIFFPNIKINANSLIRKTISRFESS